MTEAIKRLDAETVVMNYLAPHLTVPVSTMVPDPRPPAFVRIMRTGGVMENRFIDRAQITIEGWAGDETTASDLVADCLAWLVRAEGALFGAVEVSGPANLPDPTSSQIRYTANIWVRIRATVITG